MKRTIKKGFALFSLLAASSWSYAQAITPSANKVIYVDKAVNGGSGNGSSWANAVPELADALKWAREKQHTWSVADTFRIYVAKGTYLPKYGLENSSYNMDKGRDNSFLMIGNVYLYGGFNPATGATTMGTRDITANETILSGDIGVSGDATDNVYHVVTATYDNNQHFTDLDGFTISDGNANGSGYSYVNGYSISENAGGGVYLNYSFINISNTVIVNNTAAVYGGGIFSYYSTTNIENGTISNNEATVDGGGLCSVSGTMAIQKSIISDNEAGDNGGGIYNFETNLMIQTSTIDNNSTVGYNGGGIYSTGGYIDIRTSTLSNNTASQYGGGIYNTTSNAQLSNLLIRNNSNGGIYNVAYMSARNLTVIDDVYMMNSSYYNYFYNSILWGGITSSNYWHFQPNNTIVKGGNGSGNLQGNFDVTSFNADGSDIFADPTNATTPDYTLKACAIAVNAGSNWDTNGSKDLNGNKRIIGSLVDLGAYEYQAIPQLTNSIGANQSFCDNENVHAFNQYKVTGVPAGSTFKWYVNGYYTGNDTDSIMPTTNYYGLFSVIVKDASGCIIGTDTALVVENESPWINYFYDQNQCDSYTLNAENPGASYVWSKDGVTISGANAQKYNVTETGKYSVMVTDTNGCVGSAVAQIIIRKANVSLGNDILSCDGAPVVLTAADTILTPYYEWYKDGAGFKEGEDNAVSITTSGEYAVYVYDNQIGCSATDTISVVIGAKPTADNVTAFIGTDCSFIFSVNNTQNVSSYAWDFGDTQTATTSLPSATHTFATSTSHTVKVTMTDANACGTLDKQITIESCEKLGINEADLASGVTLYPNPSSDYIQFEMAAEITLQEVTVMDNLGRVVFQNAVTNNTQINVSQFANGFYTAILTTNQGNVMKKFEVMK